MNKTDIQKLFETEKHKLQTAMTLAMMDFNEATGLYVKGHFGFFRSTDFGGTNLDGTARPISRKDYPNINIELTLEPDNYVIIKSNLK